MLLQQLTEAERENGHQSASVPAICMYLNVTTEG
jgi:hypothetical protein